MEFLVLCRAGDLALSVRLDVIARTIAQALPPPNGVWGREGGGFVVVVSLYVRRGLVHRKGQRQREPKGQPRHHGRRTELDSVLPAANFSQHAFMPPKKCDRKKKKLA